jgi:hypothetical protein
MVTSFNNQDEQFELWRDTHPAGFIVNHDPVPTPSYVVLHRADCASLRRTNGSNWTVSYGKTCGERLDDIRSWARKRMLDPRPCGMCTPPSLS